MAFLGPQGPAPNQISKVQSAQIYELGDGAGIVAPSGWASPVINIYGKPNVSLTLGNLVVLGTRADINVYYTRIRVLARIHEAAFYTVYDSMTYTGVPPDPPGFGAVPWDTKGSPAFVWREQIWVPATEIQVIIDPYVDSSVGASTTIGGSLTIQATA